VRHKDLQGISIVLYVSLRSRLKPTASNTNMTPESKDNTDSFLEVESEDERIKRIERLLASQAASDRPTIGRSRRADGTPSFPASDGLGPYRVDPPTALLARAAAFLPQLRQANEQLDPQTANIENGEGERCQYIEMTLGLGVFEQRRREEGSGSLSESSSSSHSSSSDGDEEDDENDGDGEEEEGGEAFQVSNGEAGRRTRTAPLICEMEIGQGQELDDTNECAPSL